MAELGERGPTFARPPVFETRLSVQFAPLLGFRAAHFGAFWRDCLGESEWVPIDDTAPQPRQVEVFDTVELNPSVPDADSWFEQSLALQAVYRSRDDRDTVLFQPNRLTYRCPRHGGGRTYIQIRETFDPVMAALEQLAGRAGFGGIAPDWWEVNYLNVLPQGELWNTPQDWPKVLPGLFAVGVPTGLDPVWTSFTGDWYFELPSRAGRLQIGVMKSVSNQTGQIALLLKVRASGPLGPETPHDWRGGLDLGHHHAVNAFTRVVSSEALTSWGYKS